VFIANHHKHGDAVTLQKFADASHFIRESSPLHCARVVGRYWLQAESIFKKKRFYIYGFAGG